MPQVQTRLAELLQQLTTLIDQTRGNPFYNYPVEQLADSICEILISIGCPHPPLARFDETLNGVRMRGIRLTSAPWGGFNKARFVRFTLFVCEGNTVRDAPAADFETARRVAADTLNEWRRWAKSADFPAPSDAGRAVNSKLFPRGLTGLSLDERDLAVQLATYLGGAMTMNQIARDFTRETAESWPKAKALLRRIRRHRKAGLICLPDTDRAD